jgi:hypothetical protein
MNFRTVKLFMYSKTPHVRQDEGAPLNTSPSIADSHYSRNIP